MSPTSHEQRGDESGLSLSRAYYHECVAPIVTTTMETVPHSAALIGDGSEVLGFDTARSRDHDWGPRVMVFLPADAFPDGAERLTGVLARQLPTDFHGHSTRFHRGDPSSPSGPSRMGDLTSGVEIHEPRAFAQRYLGLDPRDDMSPGDWMALPWGLLRGLVGGEVFHDGLGDLAGIRDAVEWYPHDLWLHVIACQWQRINQEEPFVGRTAEVDAELGSRLVAHRQIRDIIHLCFLCERRYPPYIKWLATALVQLRCGEEIAALCTDASGAQTWPDRQDALGALCRRVAQMHNALGITEHVDDSLQQFHDRPFAVLNSWRFVDATRAAITDPAARDLPVWGCISQYADSTDILSSGAAARRIARVCDGRPDSLSPGLQRLSAGSSSALPP